jgi:hypothetical protein
MVIHNEIKMIVNERCMQWFYVLRMSEIHNYAMNVE